MKKELIKKTEDGFQENFHHKPEAVFLAPGRINIIGEHLDYNHGFVVPAAINKYICFCISLNQTNNCQIVALDLNEKIVVDLSKPLQPIDILWANYILGVLHELQKHAPLQGFNLTFSSNVPMGAGLSSSAALECGMGFALNDLLKIGLDEVAIAKIGQKSEHDFVGVKCGIMDQYASVLGRKNQAILLDCITNTHEYLHADFDNYQLLLIDSCVKHSHLTSGYNTRREEIAEGFAIIQNNFPDIKDFRMCKKEHLLVIKDQMSMLVYNRCLFVVEEIMRVEKAVQAIESGNNVLLGKLLYEAHDGLSKLYEVSCEELDFLVDQTRDNDFVLGARMMGGGFGGCTLNLIKKKKVDHFIKNIAEKYKKQYNIDLKAYPIKISEGIHKVEDSTN
jgi:galactokinase